MNKPLANDALTDNLRKAQTYLSRFKSAPVPHRIAGESVTGAETFENYDPTDNSVLCNVSSGGAAAIDRKAANGRVLNAGESLTAAEALAAYTEGGAFAMGHEQRRGRIAVGQYADLAVLDRDVLALPPEAIEATRARLTLIGGETVFSDGTLAVK